MAPSSLLLTNQVTWHRSPRPIIWHLMIFLGSHLRIAALRLHQACCQCQLLLLNSGPILLRLDVDVVKECQELVA